MVLKKLTLVGASREKPLFDPKPRYLAKKKSRSSTTTPTRLSALAEGISVESAHRVQNLEVRDNAANGQTMTGEHSSVPVLKQEDAVDTIESGFDIQIPDLEDEDGAIVLDASTSKRQYYRDPLTSLRREVWRPGMTYFHIVPLHCLN